MATFSTTTALSAFQTLFSEGNVRAHAVHDDLMEPTVAKGEFVGVIPCDKYEYPAVYLLDHCGYPQIFRCQRIPGNLIQLTVDHPNRPITTNLSIDDFNDVVLGTVVAVCSRIDRHDRLDRRAA